MKNTTNTTNINTDSAMCASAARAYLKTNEPTYKTGSFTAWSWEWKEYLECYVYNKYHKSLYIPVYEDFLVINKLLERMGHVYKTRYRIATFFKIIGGDPAIYNAVKSICKALDAAYMWELIKHGIKVTEDK